MWYAVFTFRGCRMPGDHRFTLDKCKLTGQVINIRKAEIGVSRDWRANGNPPTCYSTVLYCSVSQSNNFHDEIGSCNGKPNCSFSQAVFNYASYSRLCSMITRRNFIQLHYSCINGKKNLYGLRFLLYSEFFAILLRIHGKSGDIGINKNTFCPITALSTTWLVGYCCRLRVCWTFFLSGAVIDTVWCSYPILSHAYTLLLQEGCAIGLSHRWPRDAP